MVIDYDEIELFTKQLDFEELNILYSRIEKSFKQFEKTKINIEIKINIENLRNGPNAYVENDSTIVIDKKLLDLVNYYLYKKLFVDSLIFNNLKEDLINDTYLLVREFMIEFIIYHELSHIWNNHSKIKKNNLQNEKLLELDADRKAVNLLAGKYLKMINKHGLNKYRYLIETFIYSLLYLFHLLHFLDKNDSNNTHPKILDRIAIILPAFIEVKNKNIIAISIEELSKSRDLCVKNFFIKYKDYYEIDEKKLLIYNQNLVKEYFCFVREHDL